MPLNVWLLAPAPELATLPAALSAGAVLTALGWASLLMVAVPMPVLHALLMAAWLLRRQPAGAGGRSSPR